MAHISPNCARKLASEESKNKILDAFYELIQEKGFSKTTTNDICDRAGVSNGCFFHHFPTKDDILKEWYLRFIENVSKKIDALEDKCAEEKILLYFDEYTSLVMDMGLEIACNIFTGKNKTLGSHTHDSLKTLFDLTVEFLKDISLDEIYRAENIDRYFLMVSRGVLLEWCVKDGGFDAKKKMHTVIQIGIDAIKSKKYDFS